MNDTTKPTLVNFHEMAQDTEYKNINTYDDQRYKRMGRSLFTKSKMSGGFWNPSSATRNHRNFYLASEGEGKKR